MKTITKTLLALTAGSLFAAGANAAVYSTTTTGYAGQPYVGVKAGQFNTDVEGADTDNATAYGVYAGYQFDPNWGVEAEYMGSDKADLDYGNGVTGEYDAKTYGAYGTYKYNMPASPVYVKGKLGVAKTEIDGSAQSTLGTIKRSVSSDDTSLAGGLALGYSAAPNMALEAGYNYTGEDSQLWTIGAHYKF